MVNPHPARIVGLVIATLAVTAAVTAAQAPDTAAIIKRLDSLEATQKVIQKQLDEIKSLLQQAQRSPVQRGPIYEIQGLESDLANAATKGQQSAKFVLIEFSDFQCPFCGRYYRDTYRNLMKEFVDSGQIRYVFRHLPLEGIHPQAFKAAEAGICAREQGRFWELHDQLFANQQALTPAALVTHAGAVGLEPNKFQICLDGGSAANEVRADLAEAARLGIESTPTFLIGEVQQGGKVKLLRKISGAQPFGIFQSALKVLLTTSEVR